MNGTVHTFSDLYNATPNLRISDVIIDSEDRNSLSQSLVKCLSREQLVSWLSPCCSTCYFKRGSERRPQQQEWGT